ncbi:MAG: hypothetical protein IPM32_10920 [Ignavibacteriae bacterium]|nr:hypothetical protein [Ignavibacteriota bacterium]
MKKKYLNNLFFLLMFFLLTNNSNVIAQRKGEVVFGVSLGIISKGFLSLKYFPVDGNAIEIHGGILPGLYNYGLALHHYFDLSRPNSFIQIGISNFGGISENISDDTTNNIDTLGSSILGINIGFGREFTSEKEVYFFAGGPTFVIDKHINCFDRKSNKYFEEQELDFGLIGFIEVGRSFYPKKK